MCKTVGDYERAQNLSHEVCGVITSCGTKMRVQSQCMYATRPLKCGCNVSTSSLVSCLVSCMLFASFQLLFDDAVVRRTLVLIAFTVAIVFIVAILHRILLYWRYSVYTSTFTVFSVIVVPTHTHFKGTCTSANLSRALGWDHGQRKTQRETIMITEEEGLQVWLAARRQVARQCFEAQSEGAHARGLQSQPWASRATAMPPSTSFRPPCLSLFRFGDVEVLHAPNWQAVLCRSARGGALVVYCRATGMASASNSRVQLGKRTEEYVFSYMWIPSVRGQLSETHNFVNLGSWCRVTDCVADLHGRRVGHLAAGHSGFVF